MDCNEDVTMRQQQIKTIRTERRTIIIAQIGTKRSRFSFWVRMKWGILRGWLWKDILIKIMSKRRLQAYVHKGTTWHIPMLLTIIVTEAPSIKTTIWTIHYYLRIFCWAMDRVVHTLFFVVCYISGCLGRASIHTNIRIHFPHHHVWDKIVIME